MAGIVPRIRWVVTILYAVVANVEADAKSGAESRRAKKRADHRVKDWLVPVKRWRWQEAGSRTFGARGQMVCEGGALGGRKAAVHGDCGREPSQNRRHFGISQPRGERVRAHRRHQGPNHSRGRGLPGRLAWGVRVAGASASCRSRFGAPHLGGQGERLVRADEERLGGGMWWFWLWPAS